MKVASRTALTSQECRSQGKRQKIASMVEAIEALEDVRLIVPLLISEERELGENR